MDMAKLVKCYIHEFADDTQVYVSFSKPHVDHARNKIQTAVENIAEYSIKQGLKLNANKTKLIILGSTSSNVASHMHITLNNEIIENSDTVKNLSFVMDSFSKHVNSITQKGFNELCCLYRSRIYLDDSIKKTLCDSLVLSYANYGDAVYDPCLDYSHKIQKLQN